MIPLFKPSYGPEELEALREPFQTGWIGLGPRTKQFEDAFAAYLGSPFAVAVNSCTAALHLAMLSFDLKDREVITTPMTFVSTNHAILYASATPVFCDIEPDTLNIDADKIEALVTDRTAAIAVVHYGGHACRMDRILDIARRHGLRVIEDVAHACGGEFEGKKLGTLGDIGCFSFHAVKNLATGEGGMITLADPDRAARLNRLRWMGISRGTHERTSEKGYSWYYDVNEVGFKAHMSDIEASLGLVQLAKLDRMNGRRREIARLYDVELAGVGWIERPPSHAYTKHAGHNYVVKTDHRDRLNAHLKDRGISTGVHYVPNNHYEMYRSCLGETPVCERVWKRILSLPMFPDLTDGQVAEIGAAIRAFEP